METEELDTTQNTVVSDAEHDETASDADELNSVRYGGADVEVTEDSVYVDLNSLLDKYGEYLYDDDDTETYTEISPSSIHVTTTGLSEGLQLAAIVASTVGMFILMFSLLVSIYMAIVQYRISKKMGRSTAFAVLAIFFWPIMAGILAFSKNANDAKLAEPIEDKPTTPDETAANA
ncbi:hypothetical protein IK146_01395 [Candidatus Saccharibacteria bacterium]|nr:hypothetical protein [Candidatus Saccharibacteria bacterium]